MSLTSWMVSTSCTESTESNNSVSGAWTSSINQTAFIVFFQTEGLLEVCLGHQVLLGLLGLLVDQALATRPLRSTILRWWEVNYSIFLINRSFYWCNNGETLSLTLHLPRIFLFLDPEFRSWMSSSVKQGAPGPAGSPGLPGPPGPQGPPGVSSATVYGSGGRGHSLEEIQRYLQGESDGEKEDHVCYLVLNQVKNDPCTYRKHISLMATCRFIWWKV